VRLVLAGRGAAHAIADLERRAREGGIAGRVELRPNIDEGEKRRLLSSCLLFCTPSRFEGFGIAVLEANARGWARRFTWDAVAERELAWIRATFLGG
jgi:glycosyltransferase involved in cell wall biosynthesis